MNHPLRIMAGAFAGTGALMFIYLGQYALAVGILMGMLGFFVGEANGKATSTAP